MKLSACTFLVALNLGLALPFAAYADTHGGSATAEDKSAAALSEGVVRKVDKAQAKLTVRHGPLANLDMPPMTMVFRVSDPTWLDAIKPGDDIRFRAERVGGVFTITRLEAVR